MGSSMGYCDNDNRKNNTAIKSETLQERLAREKKEADYWKFHDETQQVERYFFKNENPSKQAHKQFKDIPNMWQQHLNDTMEFSTNQLVGSNHKKKEGDVTQKSLKENASD